MKTLYLLRHAKSDWGDSGLDDHDRPLDARGERAEVAFFGEFGEVGQLALVEESLCDFGVHAVEAEDDEAFDTAISVGPLSADCADDVSNGPGQEGDECGSHRGEHDEETAEDCKAGTGADIGIGGVGDGQEQNSR